MIAFYPVLETGSLWAACLVSAENSFFLIPLVPIMLELGCEIVFPVGEGAAVGLLFAAGNLFGFVLGTKVGLCRFDYELYCGWGVEGQYAWGDYILPACVYSGVDLCGCSERGEK